MILTSSRLDLLDLFDPTKWNTLFEWVSLSQFLLAMMIATLIGVIIFFLYRWTYKGSVYSFNFNASLVALTMITSVIMMMVSSNLVLSLGALGALSIVRFRTPIKDPTDMVYLFFAIGEGIVIGTGLYGVVFVSTLFVGVTLVVISQVKQRQDTYLLVIKIDRAHAESITNQLKIKGYIKNLTLIGNQSQIDALVRGEDNAQNLYRELQKNNEILALSLIKFEQ